VKMEKGKGVKTLGERAMMEEGKRDVTTLGE
jgi:hypothetical protein